jgi:hypothetical protein
MVLQQMVSVLFFSGKNRGIQLSLNGGIAAATGQAAVSPNGQIVLPSIFDLNTP